MISNFIGVFLFIGLYLDNGFVALHLADNKVESTFTWEPPSTHCFECECRRGPANDCNVVKAGTQVSCDGFAFGYCESCSLVLYPRPAGGDCGPDGGGYF